MRPRSLVLVVLGCLLAAEARAEQAPVVVQRVDRRLVLKTGRPELSLGLAYFARGDFYQNVGLGGTFAYWLDEKRALELQGALYYAADTDAVVQVREDLGFVPSSQREEGTLTGGGRWSLAYGKALVGDTVIHFDPQAFAHVGLHATEGSIGPMLDGGVALAARPRPWLLLRVDLAVVLQAEERRDGWSVVLGLCPMFGAGVLL